MKDRISIPKSIDESASIDDLRFIFNQAKDRISVLTDDAEKLYQRSVVLITIGITAITAIIGYIGSNLVFSFSTMFLGTAGALLWRALSQLKPNIIPKDYWGIGSHPKTLATDAFFTKLEGKEPEWHLLYSEIISYQQRIDENIEINNERAENIKDAINTIYSIPFMSIIILLLFAILGRL